MRIAQIAPLWETVPPRTYGGTELVVSLLTDGLVKRGHEVTLFATGDSSTLAKLDPGYPKPFRGAEEELELEKGPVNVTSIELKMLSRVVEQAGHFDVIHNHMGFQALPFAQFTDTPMVTTLHNGLQPHGMRDLFYHYPHLPMISISDYQRTLWPGLNYASTIYHGIQTARFQPRLDQDANGYFVFLGRFSEEKGPHLAIEIARALGRKLVMAGKVDFNDRPFFDRVIAPQINNDDICYIGEVDHERKVALLRNASATLHPVQWPEPFGLVIIESLACGTPVFALRDGSIPEVINHNVTGFVGSTTDDLIRALKRLDAFDRRICRLEAEQRFSVERMVEEHEHLYERLAFEREKDYWVQGVLSPTQLAETHRALAEPSRQVMHWNRS